MIQRTIGHGGMGAVYLARDLRRQTYCAIKEMSLSMVPPEDRAQAVQNFKAEARMLASLNHPNLPTFSGFFTEGQRHFLVMEYIDGMTLDDFLEHNRGPFPERRVLAWARQLCDVLTYLHSQHPPIIFRDMKPGNIMLMRNGRVKLIDFGIARFFRHASSQDTQLLGTPGFAPPEQYGKAQTDERSDIYSLAMTLFQLLTNTLSEKGFGLQDVHAINPGISLHVARTLEKATSLKPEDRFQTVEAFRRALLGEGTFQFESGDQAATPEELADLCERFPEEAADYLFAGEIEHWLEGIGESQLAQATKEICTLVHDPQEAVVQFVQAMPGSNARLRSSIGKKAQSRSSRSSRSSQAGIPVFVPLVPTVPTVHSTVPPLSSSRGSISRVPVVDIEVEPRVLDFGEIRPRLSEPLMLSITSNRGNYMRGTLTASAPWMVLDQSVFDGTRTDIAVQIDATRLRGSTHYTGTIFVIPDEEDEEQDITVRVEVDVLGNISSLTGQQSRVQARSMPGTLFDDDEEEDEPASVSRSNGTGTAGNMRMAPPTNTNAAPPPNTRYSNEKYDEYTKKYGLYTGNTGGASRGWEPVQASPRQQLWLQRGLIVLAAFMLASLFYTLVAKYPVLARQSILSPNPWFIVVLLGIMPAATIGAMVLNWNRHWSVEESISRFCTGLVSTLVTLGAGELLWETLLRQNAPPLQLFVMLLLAAVTATVGTNAFISEKIIDRTLWLMNYMRRAVIVALVVVGGLLGFVLSIGFALSGFTLLAIAWGIGIAALFSWQLDHLLKQEDEA
jgi:serine/threonine protein kinase